MAWKASRRRRDIASSPLAEAGGVSRALILRERLEATCDFFDSLAWRRGKLGDRPAETSERQTPMAILGLLLRPLNTIAVLIGLLMAASLVELAIKHWTEGPLTPPVADGEWLIFGISAFFLAFLAAANALVFVMEHKEWMKPRQAEIFALREQRLLAKAARKKRPARANSKRSSRL